VKVDWFEEPALKVKKNEGLCSEKKTVEGWLRPTIYLCQQKKEKKKPQHGFVGNCPFRKKPGGELSE